ncbi:Hsp70 family protein [Roseiconus lacunae]|nr:Hsp70 family protein [Roseiconus lacunae]
MSKAESPIVGIDLGTTNSVVAAVVDGKPQVFICDERSSMPSVVGLGRDGTLVTGIVARNQLAAFPDQTVASIKRKMGTMETIRLGDQDYTPPEISGMILRRLRDVASRALGCDVTRAVITVPAYFDEAQRQATREAGKLAGLTVERIINEPTAAALVYHADSQDRKHIAVYDFGGGTFDVSVVRMEAGVTEVLSSQGDTVLGGDDLDQVLLDHVAVQFLEEHDVDLRKNPQSRFRVLQACEHAKMQLSEVESTRISEEFVIEKDGKPLNLDVPIDRKTLDELIEPFVERTIACVGKALQDASMAIHHIDDFVLVGGSTRLDLVSEKLRQQFQCDPCRAVDPDLAVAMGAALQAAMIQGQSVGPVLVDVATHTLGIEVADEMTFSGPKLGFAPIIRRNSPLPARHEESFAKLYDDQEVVQIRVLQGEHSNPSRNTRLGDFELNVKGEKSDQQKLVVGFNLTLDGTLRVTAKQPGTGRVEELTIDNTLTRFAEDDRERAALRLNQMFEESSELLDADELPVSESRDQQRVDQPHQNPAANEAARQRFPRAHTLLDKAIELQGTIGSEDAEELRELRDRLIAAIEADDAKAVEDLTVDLDDLLFYVQ